MSYFSEPYTHSKSKIKVELNLSNYATTDLKNATDVDLGSLKSDVDEFRH